MSIRQVEFIQQSGVSQIIVQALKEGVNFYFDQTIIVCRVCAVQPPERFIGRMLPSRSQAAEQALSLDPNLAEAHNQMGRIQQQIDFDWTILVPCNVLYCLPCFQLRLRDRLGIY